MGTVENSARLSETLLPSQSTPHPSTRRVEPSPLLARNLGAEANRLRSLLGMSQREVDDRAGIADGLFGKLLNPDGPNGRPGTLRTWDEVLHAICGGPYTIEIRPVTEIASAVPIGSVDPNAPARMIRHWRHTAHFRSLGRLGGQAAALSTTREQREAWGREGALKRWHRVKERDQ